MVIKGTGSSLPERVLTNSHLEEMVNTSDEWITLRTGIKTRHIAGAGEETSDLAAAAAMKALAMAEVDPAELDVIIVGTITPEMTMPSCACLVQQKIGAVRAHAFDLNAACSGFLFALDLADKYLKADPGMKILVIGAETLSTRTNWQDRNTCVLFGDAAGAAVVAASSESQGMIASKLYSDGRLSNLLFMNSAPRMSPDGPRDEDKPSVIQMAGRDVFKHAVRSLAGAVDEVLAGSGFARDDISLLIPHQANIRIIASLSERLALPMEKIYINLYKYGNTSAASIPVALDEANRTGRLKRGDLVLFCAFGGGFTWGASLFRW